MKKKSKVLVMIMLSLFSLFVVACNQYKLPQDATDFIAKVDALGTITIASEAKLTEAIGLYDALDATAKADATVVAAKTKYDTAKGQFDAIKVVAGKIATFIAKVDAFGTITIASEAKLTEAIGLYDGLDATAKADATVVAAKTKYDNAKGQFDVIKTAADKLVVDTASANDYNAIADLVPAVNAVACNGATLDLIVTAEEAYEALNAEAKALVATASKSKVEAARAEYDRLALITAPMNETTLVEVAADGNIVLPTYKTDMSALRVFFEVGDNVALAGKINLFVNIYFDSATDMTAHIARINLNIVNSESPNRIILASDVINKLKEIYPTNNEISPIKHYKFSINYEVKDDTYLNSNYSAFSKVSSYYFHIAGTKIDASSTIVGITLNNGNINYNPSIAKDRLLNIFGNHNEYEVQLHIFNDTDLANATSLGHIVINVDGDEQPSMDKLTTDIARLSKPAGLYKFAVKVVSRNEAKAISSDMSAFTASYQYAITAESHKTKLTVGTDGMVIDGRGLVWGAANPWDRMRALYGSEEAMQNGLEYNILVYAHDALITDTPLFWFNVTSLPNPSFDNIIQQFGIACAAGHVSGTGVYKLAFQAKDTSNKFRNSDIAGFVGQSTYTFTAEDAIAKVTFGSIGQVIDQAGRAITPNNWINDVTGFYGVTGVDNLTTKAKLMFYIYADGDNVATATPLVSKELAFNNYNPTQAMILEFLAQASVANTNIVSGGRYFVAFQVIDLTTTYRNSNISVCYAAGGGNNPVIYTFTDEDKVSRLPNVDMLMPNNNPVANSIDGNVVSISVSSNYLTKYSSQYRPYISAITYNLYVEKVLVKTLKKDIDIGAEEIADLTLEEIIALLDTYDYVDKDFTVKILFITNDVTQYRNSVESGATASFKVNIGPAISITNEATTFKNTDLETNPLAVTSSIANSQDKAVYSLKTAAEGVALAADPGVVTFTATDTVTFTVVATIGATEVKAEKTFTITYYTLAVPVITTAAEFRAIGNDADSLKGNYTLANDINVSGIEWTNLGIFEGTLDGKGYSIINLGRSIGGADFGLFKENKGIIKNLKVQGSTVDCGAWYGVIAVDNFGTISNCIVDFVINAKGEEAYGGLISVNNKAGTIEFCIILGENNGEGTAWNANMNGSIVCDNFIGADVENCIVIDTACDYAVGKSKNEAAFQAMIKSEADMKLATTYSKFNTEIWNIVDGSIPTLIIQK